MKENSLYFGFAIFTTLGVVALCGLIHSSFDLIVRRAFLFYIQRRECRQIATRADKLKLVDSPAMFQLTTGKRIQKFYKNQRQTVNLICLHTSYKGVRGEVFDLSATFLKV